MRAHFDGLLPIQAQVQRLEAEEGELLAQVDGASVHPVYWRQGDRLITQFDLLLPVDLPPGDYELHLGMYTWPEVVRVPLAGGQETTVMVAEFQLP